jgi:hypothetical protein
MTPSNPRFYTVKNSRGPKSLDLHERWRESVLFLSNPWAKIFLSCQNETPTQTGSSDLDPWRNWSKSQTANISGSGWDPDSKIGQKAMRMHMDLDSWIRIQDFVMQIRHGIFPWVRPKNTPTIFMVSPEHVRTGWSLHFRLTHAFGDVTGMPWMPD